MAEPNIDIAPKLSISEMPPDFSFSAEELDQWAEVGPIQGARSSSHMFREYRTFTKLTEIMAHNPITPQNTEITFFGCSDGREIASALSIFRDSHLPFTGWQMEGVDHNGSVLNPTGSFTFNIRDKLAVKHSGHDLDELFSTNNGFGYTLRSPLFEAYQDVTFRVGDILDESFNTDTDRFRIIVARNMFYQNVQSIPDVINRFAHLSPGSIVLLGVLDLGAGSKSGKLLQRGMSESNFHKYESRGPGARIFVKHK